MPKKYDEINETERVINKLIVTYAAVDKQNLSGQISKFWSFSPTKYEDNKILFCKENNKILK